MASGVESRIGLRGVRALGELCLAVRGLVVLRGRVVVLAVHGEDGGDDIDSDGRARGD